MSDRFTFRVAELTVTGSSNLFVMGEVGSASLNSFQRVSLANYLGPGQRDGYAATLNSNFVN
ncbi:hypothetical protein NicSoilE8_42790 (plasmid) [Arthrobacter sp. NicSoilE8]|nr:hypothetical protein NicSoilE8_42790 [Arthrobacter sp. NicSoilE8]